MTATGHSRSVVAAKTDALVRAGLVKAAGEASSTGGRPPTTFVFDANGKVVIGVDLSLRSATAGLVNLNGDLITSLDGIWPTSGTASEVAEWVFATSRSLLDSVGRRPEELLGVGIALPGHPRRNSPESGYRWTDEALIKAITTRLQVPVFSDLSIHMEAAGEHQRYWAEEQDVLYVSVGEGIHAGVIMDGQLHTGHLGAAGDLGHVVVPAAETVPCRCGNYGCLRTVASGSALVRKFRNADLEISDVSSLCDQARAGNPEVRAAIRSAGREIGKVLSTCVSLLNPGRIIVGGSMIESGEGLIAGIRETVYGRALPYTTHELEVSSAKGGEYARVLGGAFAALSHGLSSAAVESLLGDTPLNETANQ